MKLYTYFRSSAAFRARIALNLKECKYESIFVVLPKGEQHNDAYKTMNPLALIPAIEHNGHILTESLAIMEYLEEIIPTPTILPADPLLRAKARATAQVIACDIHPLNNLRVLNYLTQQLHIDAEQKNTWYQHWIMLGFNALELQLNSHADLGPFAFGQYPTIADICLVPQLFNARRIDVDLTPYPRLVAIEAACLELPAFLNALPENQPDATI